MRIRKMFASLLALLMLFTALTACADTEEPVESAPSGGNTADPGVPPDDGDAIETIEFWMSVMGTATDTEAVDEAINAITEKEIGVHVNFNRLQSADYGTQLVLAIGNGEQIDLASYIPFGGGSFLNLYSTGCIMDITDIAAEYGRDILSLFGEDLIAGTIIDGKLYGIPTYRQLNSNWYINMRTDVLEDLGLADAAASMKTWADFEAIMDAVKNSEWELYAIGGGGGNGFVMDSGSIFCGTNLSDTIAFDTLGDSMYAIMTDQEGNVYNMVESAECQEQFKMFARWMAAGYVYPDTPYDTDSYQAVMAKGVNFSSLCQSEYGVEVNWKQSTTYDLTCVQLVPGYLSTAVCQKFGCFVPTSAQYPEAAVKFLNLLYNSPELMNLAIYGIEGTHYVINDNGEGCYPDGKDAAAVGYHGADFGLGNQFLCHPWLGNGGDFRDLALDNFKNAPVSMYMGLTVDTSAYDTLVANISAVTAEFRGIMASGYYTDTLYQEYVEKLQAAGVDEYVALFQSAVDEYAA